MIRSQISSMIRSQITSMVNPNAGGGAEQRIFIDLDPVANGFYELATPIVMTGDFSVKANLSSPLGSSSALCGGASGASHITINTDLTIRIRINNQSVLSSSVTGLDDGRLHLIEFIRTGSTGEIFIDGVSFEVFGSVSIGLFTIDFIGQQNNLSFFDGILANPTFNNNGTITSFNLDEATSNTELSNEGNNTLTYNNIALDDRELFTLVGNDWVGQELVVNGGFATDSDWVLGVGTSISGGEAHYTSAATSIRITASVDVPVSVGARYLATHKITQITEGGLFTVISGRGTPTNTSIGDYSFVVEILSLSSTYTRSSGTTTASIDDFSVKRILETP